MPGLDKTGPTGRGSMTGRGRGVCRQATVMMVSTQPNESVRDISSDYVEKGSSRNEEETVIFGRGRGGIPCGAARRYGRGGIQGRGTRN